MKTEVSFPPLDLTRIIINHLEMFSDEFLIEISNKIDHILQQRKDSNAQEE